MVRRGQAKSREVRRARREAKRAVESELGQYEAPDREDCEPNDWYYYDEAVRVHFYTWKFDGRLADFAILFKVLGPEGEFEVERIDCAHGHCHHHNNNGSCEGLMRLDAIDDVQLAFDRLDPVVEQRVGILVARLRG
jgi:hypothetical protein